MSGDSGGQAMGGQRTVHPPGRVAVVHCTLTHPGTRGPTHARTHPPTPIHPPHTHAPGLVAAVDQAGSGPRERGAGTGLRADQRSIRADVTDALWVEQPAQS